MSTPALAWRIADGVMLLAFVFSVLVQYNDPDPLTWMAIYGLAAGVCLASLLGRVRLLYPAAVALVATGWAVSLAPRVVGHVPFLDMFEAFEMADIGVEQSREMYGLLIIAVWMTVVAARARKTGSAT